ncbi:hypothetical protein NDU88_001884 [Pleurodeles waltl]|uniref:Uncharacterized protein n=1 Tax=Pleurodeles waltl TaxID=8319 RepID=A0AAV7WM80_PLEWA|nr:hypothetical protein NDU88_001884 [Pleurodeles waltl]
MQAAQFWRVWGVHGPAAACPQQSSVVPCISASANTGPGGSTTSVSAQQDRISAGDMLEARWVDWGAQVQSGSNYDGGTLNSVLGCGSELNATANLAACLCSARTATPVIVSSPTQSLAHIGGLSIAKAVPERGALCLHVAQASLPNHWLLLSPAPSRAQTLTVVGKSAHSWCRCHWRELCRHDGSTA